MMNVRLAQPQEAPELTEIALRSKAFWGYSEAFMAACVDEMTIQAQSIENPNLAHWVAIDDAEFAGFYVLDWKADDYCELDALYVDPDRIGQGCGKTLLTHAKGQAEIRGVRRVTIQSDPNAEAFYLAMGAVRVGLRESGSIAGRQLPLLEIRLPDPR